MNPPAESSKPRASWADLATAGTCPNCLLKVVPDGPFCEWCGALLAGDTGDGRPSHPEPDHELPRGLRPEVQLSTTAQLQASRLAMPRPADVIAQPALLAPATSVEVKLALPIDAPIGADQMPLATPTTLTAPTAPTTVAGPVAPTAPTTPAAPGVPAAPALPDLPAVLTTPSAGPTLAPVIAPAKPAGAGQWLTDPALPTGPARPALPPTQPSAGSTLAAPALPIEATVAVPDSPMVALPTPSAPAPKVPAPTAPGLPTEIPQPTEIPRPTQIPRPAQTAQPTEIAVPIESTDPVSAQLPAPVGSGVGPTPVGPPTGPITPKPTPGLAGPIRAALAAYEAYSPAPTIELLQSISAPGNSVTGPTGLLIGLEAVGRPTAPTLATPLLAPGNAADPVQAPQAPAKPEGPVVPYPFVPRLVIWPTSGPGRISGP